MFVFSYIVVIAILFLDTGKDQLLVFVAFYVQSGLKKGGRSDCPKVRSFQKSPVFIPLLEITDENNWKTYSSYV